MILDQHAPRAAIEHEVERLIGILDALDPDPDLEPSLGGDDEGGRYAVDAELDTADLEHSMGSLDRTMDQTRWAFGAGGDLEQQCEDEGAQCDDEGEDADTELDHADSEPWLGALERHEEGQPFSWGHGDDDREDEVRVFCRRPPRLSADACGFREAEEVSRLADQLRAIVTGRDQAANRSDSHA